MNFNFKPYEISLIKLTTVAIAFLLINVWQGIADFVMNTNWVWFLVAAIVFAIKPLITMFNKQ